MSYNITNEQLLLIDILNSMYNDNIRQINTLNNSINNLTENNNQIRNLLIQILNTSTNANTTTNASRRNLHRTNTRRYNSNTNNNRERIVNENESLTINNIPYVIDSIQYYTIPSQNNTTNTNTSRSSNFSRIFENFLQPVEIYPTQTQIESATRIVRYSDIITPNNTSCPISLANFNDSDNVTVIRHCGHIFNSVELNTWFRSNCRCPVCRYDIRNYNTREYTRDISNNSIEQENNEQNISNNSENVSQNNTYNNINNSILNDSILNEFSNDLSNITDPTALLSLFNALQRRTR